MRLDQEKEAKLQPLRMAFAKKYLIGLGFEIIEETDKRLRFIFRGEKVTLYPYSGWFSGKSVHDGRGIMDLISQLKSKQ